MSDLIDRQAAIGAVGWYSCHSGDKLLFADNVLKQLPSAELELKELKAEADKLGYRLVKKAEKIKLLPCSCGCKKKPTEWVKASSENGGWFYKCDYCDKKSEVVATKIGAKRAWNRMILEGGKGEQKWMTALAEVRRLKRRDGTK